LTTPRLTLSVHGLKDFGDCAALWADPDVVRFIGGRPFTSEEVWTRLLRYVGHWAAMGYGYWAIRERVSGRYVGEIGFGDFRRELEPPFGPSPEAGWALAPWAQGRGLAREALTAALSWGDGRMGAFSRTVCMIHPDNRPSITLATSHGYRPFAETRYKGSPTILFERVRPPAAPTASHTES
jgi:RimJ/RimL family protein N-acetyltransferase